MGVSIDTDALLSDLKKLVNVEKLIEIITTYVVEAVEEVALARYPDMEGKTKEDLAVELLDGYIKLPGILDGKPVDIDGRMIRGAIQAAVAKLNDWKGHKWAKGDEDGI